MTSLTLRRLATLTLPMLTLLALTACSNALPGLLAVVTAAPLPQPTRPTPQAPAPVTLRDIKWQVVLDPKTHEPIFGVTAQGLYDLEANQVLVGEWMSDAKSTIDFYRADNAAANAENTPTSSAKDAAKK